jgi:site-specific DNA-methyltransferase (adenine-specific)
VTPGNPGEYRHSINDRTSPERYMAARPSEELGRYPANVLHDGSQEVEDAFPVSGKGSAARFFFCGKATKQDRQGSDHPTVKPVALMRFFCRLVTPRNGIVLDPYAGSGTTGEAAIEEGFSVILMEREAEYYEHIRARLALWIEEVTPPTA